MKYAMIKKDAANFMKTVSDLWIKDFRDLDVDIEIPNNRKDFKLHFHEFDITKLVNIKTKAIK